LTGFGSKHYNFGKSIWASHGPFSFSSAISQLSQNEASLLLTDEDLQGMRKEEAAIRKREEEWMASLVEIRQRANLTVPIDPTEFYRELGLIEHPFTRKPVTDLTHYQKDVWKAMLRYRFLEVIKSQKIGLSTSVLMTDFQFAMLPTSHPRSCRGKEILLIAQDLGKARDHLATLRQMIRSSKKYASYLIEQQASYLLRDEVTKITTLYIHNPENPHRPTIIRGLGAREGAVWSWKNVKHVHVSDIAAANIDYDPTINAALTRLVNTRGTMIIETPPRGPRGKVYEIYQKSIEAPNSEVTEGQFKVIRIHVREAIAAGVVTEEEIEGMRATLGNMFPAYFEAEFITIGGNAFPLSDIERALNNGRRLAEVLPPDLDPEQLVSGVRRYSPRAMGIDPAYAAYGSKFAIIIIELIPDPCNRNSIDDYIQVVYAHESEGASPIAELEHARELSLRYNVENIYIDASGAGYIRDLKRAFGERLDYEDRLKELKKQNIDPARDMKVVPVAFGSHGKEMLQNLQYWMHRGNLAISPAHFNNLLTQLRSAQQVNGNLDKSRDQLDLVDAFRLGMWHFLPPSQPIPDLAY